MPKKQKQNELRSKIEEEFKKSCGEELGFVSAIFMSQGKIKAKDIVMPTTELEESVDRFGLYLFEAMEKLEDLYKQEIALKIEEIEGLMEGMMPLNEEVNFEEDNEAGIRREVLLDLLASLKQNK